MDSGRRRLGFDPAKKKLMPPISDYVKELFDRQRQIMRDSCNARDLVLAIVDLGQPDRGRDMGLGRQ
jgi:hypothetical protein